MTDIDLVDREGLRTIGTRETAALKTTRASDKASVVDKAAEEEDHDHGHHHGYAH